MRILVVYSDKDAIELIDDVLMDRVSVEGHELFVDFISYEAEAMRRLKSNNYDYDLIITHLHIAEDKKSSVIADEQRGLALLQKLKKENIKIPSILVAITPDPKLFYAVQDLYKSALLFDGEEFEDNLVKYSYRALSGLMPPIGESKSEDLEEQKMASVDIKLDLDKNLWDFELKGMGRDLNYYAEGVLQIDKETMSDLVDVSLEIQEITNWERALRRIGRMLEKELFLKNPEFSRHFHTLLGLVDNERNIKFRFQVEEKAHPIAFEALLKQNDYLMLKSPIYRRLRISGQTNPTYFSRKESIKDISCLIIESNIPDESYIPEIDKELNYLKNVPIEAEWLEKYLKDHIHEFNIGRIERINENNIPKGKTFKEHVKYILKSDIWHLVHYAGHSFCDRINKKAYMFLPEKDHINTINIVEFSEWLRSAKTGFIYLSSCHSSEEDFVFELAKNYIPAIIGFRWDIDDVVAAKHAEMFYKHLFEDTRSIEYAFLETRKEMNMDCPADRAWAAPILILQVID